ncbi:MAG: FmdB family zinc ribbon protein [Gemmatimonadaceae bacterium]
MPTYDYHCRSCGEDFILREKITDHDSAHATCPRCQSEKVERVISAAYPRTARKS